MSDMKEVICTCCPQGCHLQVDEANDYKVTGNGCPNGIAYGKEELTHPTRIITSTVRAEGCLHSRCPVKTSKPVPKGQMAEVVAALDSVVLHAPIHVGDVVLTGVRHRVCVQRIPGAPAARQMGIEKGRHPVPQQATQMDPPSGRDHQFQIAVRAMISCPRAAQIAECLLKAR